MSGGNGQLMQREAPVPDACAVSLPAPAVSPLDLPAEVFRAGLDRRKDNRAALMAWIREALVEGVDYGRIHVVGKDKCRLGKHCNNPAHFSKPSLFKPGAEKICGMLGVTVHFPTLHDYEQAALSGVQLAHIIIRCELHDAAGRVVADGVGARSLKQDYNDLNKALKMAEKAGHIDATLRMAGLSEVFTQDIEDMSLGEGMDATNGAQANAPHDDAPQPPSPPPAESATTITPAQHRRLEARITQLGLDRARIKRWLMQSWQVAHLNQLPADKYAALDARLGHWAAQAARPPATPHHEEATP